MNEACAMPAPFVARSRELEALRRQIDIVGERHGSVVLISGEAGVGKTRLWQQAVTGLVGPVEVVVGRAYPEERTIGFGSVADAIRTARRQPSALWDAVRTRASLLSTIVPELAADVVSSPRALDDPVVFETLLDAVEDAATATATGVAWVFEDLHWADSGTWSFVAYAARRVRQLPLVLVATYRNEEVSRTHPWWPRIAALQLQPDVISLPLERLSPSETKEMVDALAPGLPRAEAADIVRRSAGTPLLVEELVRGGVAPRGEPGAVPEIVRATVRERFRRLDRPAGGIVELLAVIGREVTIGLLAELRPTETHEALEALVESGLVAVSARGDEPTVSFRHPLFLEAVYEDLPWTRRWQLHDEIADALEGTSDHHPPERVARHRELAGQLTAALATLLRAADAHRTRGEVGRAASLGLSALELTSRHSRLASRRELIAPTVMKDLYGSGRWTDLGPLVEEHWRRRGFRDAADRAVLANVLALYLFYTGEVQRAASVAAEEAARVEVDRSSAGALLISTAAFISWFRGEIPTALGWANQAMELAERAGEPEVICRARNVALVAHWRVERDRQVAIEGHQDNVAFAREAGLSVGEANSCWSLALLTIRTDDLIAAEQAAERAGTWYAAPARLVQGFVHVLAGRPDQAEACFASARGEICTGIPMMADAVDTAEAHLHLHRGNLASARQILEAGGAQRGGARLPSWAAARSGAEGWLAWEEGRWEAAADLLGRSTELALRCSYHAVEMGPILLPIQVDALLELGRREEAAAVIRSADVGQDHDRFSAAAVAAARFRLLLDEAMAAPASEQAVAAGWPWLEALVASWRGRWLGDAAAAIAARETFEAIQAARGVQRADAVLRRLGAHRSRGLRRGTPLSVREQEVAELVAEGLTNTEIGKRLFLSRPTVATHIGHILTKLGFASRTQIAAWVAERRSDAQG